MNQSLLIIAVTSYLVSIAASLLLLLLSKKIPTKFKQIFFALHLFILPAFFILLEKPLVADQTQTSNYLLLAFVCTGILSAGLMLRSKILLPVKIYLSLFLVSIIFFFFNPSSLLALITTGNWNELATGRIRLYENVYLVKQVSSEQQADNNYTFFKITREMGVFHKTLYRDLQLPALFDSLNATPETISDAVRLKVFYKGDQTPMVLDTVIQFGIKRDSASVITRRPK